MILPPLQEKRQESRAEQQLYHALSQCVRCAVCLPSCPTYQETLNEGHSPRGRISLVRALHEEDAEAASARLNEYLKGCLACRACETACPNNVVFHEILEYGQERLNEHDHLTPRSGRLFTWLFLKNIFNRSRNLDRLMAFLRFYQKSGLQAVVRWSRLLKLFPWNLYGLEQMMPKLGKHRPLRQKKDSLIKPAGLLRGTVQLFTGCIADHWMQPAGHATVRMLNRAGYAVRIPASQQCCGALHAHMGKRDGSRQLAKKNIAAFAHQPEEPIVVNAAGCGAMLKEYDHLLEEEGTSQEDAAAFAGRIIDVNELLARDLDHLPPMQPFEGSVTYDDPCHLVHAQGISSEPRRLLRAVPGAQVVELVESSWCCGSAGVYNVVNYDMSMKILARKLHHVAESGAEVLLTSNPGCYLQLALGVRRDKLPVRVMHIMEFLDERYRTDTEQD